MVRMPLLVIFVGLALHLKATPPGNDGYNPDSLINRVYELYDDGNYLEAIKISEFILQFESDAEATDTLLLARTIGSIALSYRELGYFHEAIFYFEKMLELSLAKGDSSWIAAAYSNRGEVLRSLGRYDESLTSFNRALLIDRALNDSAGISIDLSNIGKVYQLWEQPENSLPFYFESLGILQSLQNSEREAMMMANIGTAYHDMRNYDEALKWLNAALDIDKSTGNQMRIGSRYEQIGEVIMKQEKYDEAHEYFLKALEIFRHSNIVNSEAITLSKMASQYHLQGETQKAIDYFVQSLALSEKTGNQTIQQRNHQELAAIYEQTGNAAKALVHTKSYIALRDMFFTESAQRQLTEFRTRFESEKKEREIALLNQETLRQQLEISRTKLQRTISGILGLLLVVILGFVYYRYRTNQKHNRILSEMNAELNDLNATKNKLFAIIAHDLKNPTAAFSAITESLNTNIDSLSKENLKYYLSELSLSASSVKHLLNNLLDWARTQRDAIRVCNQELDLAELVATSAEPVLVDLHRKKIMLSTHIPEGFKVVNDKYIMQTILRNLLTNAVKFTPEGGRVDVTAQRNAVHTEMKVTDTGCGMTPEEVMNLFRIDRKPSASSVGGERGPGLGLIICRELLDKVGGIISAESTPGAGSTFTVSVPATD